MNNLKKFVLIFMASIPLLMLTKHAKAACYFGSTVTSPINKTLSLGDVIVQRDTPVGGVILTTISEPFKPENTVFGCNVGWTLLANLELFTTLSSYGNGVYDTNIDGVGIRITSTGGRYLPFSIDYDTNIYLVLPGGYKVELIRTSLTPLSGGTLANGTLLRMHPTGYSDLYVALSLSGANKIIPVACSVNNTVINVSLDDALVADFNGIGSTAKPKDFNIGLNCDAGTKVKLTLDGNAAGPEGVLALNAGTTQAEGIGIQLLKGTTPVALGSPLDFGTADTAGDMQLPLIARYYQTEAPIISGTANTTATFTLAYN